MAAATTEQMFLTNCGDECRVESIIRESKKQTSLAYTGITNEQKLKQ